MTSKKINETIVFIQDWKTYCVNYKASQNFVKVRYIFIYVYDTVIKENYIQSKNHKGELFNKSELRKVRKDLEHFPEAK